MIVAYRVARVVLAGALMVSGGASLRAAAAQSSSAQHEAAPAILKGLAGTWKAPEFKVERDSALDVSLFGPRSSDVRNVDLSLQPTGEGLLRVFTSVVDRKGRTYSPAVVEAHLTIGSPAPTFVPNKVEPAVTLVSAEERYLDGTGDHWPAEVARVTITTTDPPSNQIDVRFETKAGPGSFVATLMRQRKR